MAERRKLRFGLHIAAGLLVVALLLGFVLFRPVRLHGLAVESVTVLAPGEPDGSSKPAELATPVRIAVTFSVPRDLVALRERHDLPFVGAVLSACADSQRRNFEVLAQRAEYFGAYGRVRFLGQRGQGKSSRYRAVFDDRLTERVEGRSQDRPALGVAGGLCFSLDGGSRRTGLVTDVVPLPPRRAR